MGEEESHEASYCLWYTGGERVRETVRLEGGVGGGFGGVAAGLAPVQSKALLTPGTGALPLSESPMCVIFRLPTKEPADGNCFSG